MIDKTPAARRKAFQDFMNSRDITNRAEWAAKAGISPNTLYAFINGTSNSLSLRILEKLAAAEGCSVADLTGEPGLAGNSTSNFTTQSSLKSPPSPPILPISNDMPRDVQVMGTAAGSLGEGAFQMDNDVIDRVRRPPGIAEATDVYALYIVGSSMEPRYPEGELVYVSPRRPARIGDYVIVQVQNHAEDGIQAYIKRLVKRRPDTLVLEQSNPAATIEIPMKNIKAVHRILSLNELMGV